MIKITTTAESIEQAKALLEAGTDNLYIGEAEFGLRLPTALSHEEIREITALAHAAGKTVTVAVNALMHVDMMAKIKPFLDFLQEIKVDMIAVGDAGVIFVLQRDKYNLPFTYDASTMVASSRQVNFWAGQGAVEAVLARELPKPELEAMSGNLDVPGEILVYGATIIHQSKRPLLQNYYNFIKTDETGKDRERNLFVSEPKKEDTHYSIFEDNHGTHIFANDDLNMMSELSDLVEMGFDHWKLDGIFTRGEVFVAVTKLFVEAKELIEAGNFTPDKAFQLEEEVRKLHPAGRTLSHGFYDLDPSKIK
ncbi:peptidase U32 family protein [Lactococcus garvieae]|jgi:collagenase-like PrtC family protease|uniref:Protease n=1 Tax=Lactococcus garvieae DCC43 TaxID=1231377 RepID=K2PY97_9LACT|nr:peptidase U32 family protein [Lactococcus garvieae]EKF52421.1 Protease [Lactococcus garvieae DCC43]